MKNGVAKESSFRRIYIRDDQGNNVPESINKETSITYHTYEKPKLEKTLLSLTPFHYDVVNDPTIKNISLI